MSCGKSVQIWVNTLYAGSQNVLWRNIYSNDDIRSSTAYVQLVSVKTKRVLVKHYMIGSWKTFIGLAPNNVLVLVLYDVAVLSIGLLSRHCLHSTSLVHVASVIQCEQECNCHNEDISAFSGLHFGAELSVQLSRQPFLRRGRLSLSKSLLVRREARGGQRLRREWRNVAQQNPCHVGPHGKLQMCRLFPGGIL